MSYALRRAEGVERSGGGAQEPSALDHYLAPVMAWLEDDTVTDVCINRAGEAYIERVRGWERIDAPFVTTTWCLQLASLVGNYTGQRIASTNPILSGTLPSGARIQIVVPPAVQPNEISITIRRPASEVWTLDDLATRGVFDHVRALPRSPSIPGIDDLSDTERDLATLLQQGEILPFMRRAVHTRQTILLSGATGSGKTTVANALLLEVPPHERCISIEDAAEMILRNQPNHVRLFYSQGGQGRAEITVEDLLVSTKRMYPSRVFVSEIRSGQEVYYYLTAVASGHKGSITSAHSGSAENAFWTLAQLMQNSGPGATMSLESGVRLVQANIDVVIQCHSDDCRRHVSEIWYDPSTKRRSIA